MNEVGIGKWLRRKGPSQLDLLRAYSDELAEHPMRIAVVAFVLAAFSGCSPSSIVDDSCHGQVVIAPRELELAVNDSAEVVTQASACIVDFERKYEWRIADERLATIRTTGDSTAVVVGRAPGQTYIHSLSWDGRIPSTSILRITE